MIGMGMRAAVDSLSDFGHCGGGVCVCEYLLLPGLFRRGTAPHCFAVYMYLTALLPNCTLTSLLTIV